MTFNSGELSQEITVLVNGDNESEPNEIFSLTLNSATNANIIEPIKEISGELNEISPPTSVKLGDLESNDNAVIFAESSGFLLTDNVSVDLAVPGTISGGGNPLPGVMLPSRTVVDSFYIHFDPVGSPSSPVLVSGSVTFNSEILGIIISKNRLNLTDNLLGVPDTSYPSNQELASSLDSVTLSEDRRTLLFDLPATNGIDPIHVITAASGSKAQGFIENDDLVTQYLGPIPYLSQADSPFDLSGLGTTFFLEDFEDGVLNTPGVTASSDAGELIVNGPDLSAFSDSVDGDDGAIDGSGSQGRALAPVNQVGSSALGVTFTFDANELGGLPTEAGVVWTDGTPLLFPLSVSGKLPAFTKIV